MGPTEARQDHVELTRPDLRRACRFAPHAVDLCDLRGAPKDRPTPGPARIGRVVSPAPPPSLRASTSRCPRSSSKHSRSPQARDADHRQLRYSEFWCIASRAGRALKDSLGVVFYPSINKTQDDEFLDFLQGEAVEVVSALLVVAAVNPSWVVRVGRVVGCV